jgi:hypothetical protein
MKLPNPASARVEALAAGESDSSQCGRGRRPICAAKLEAGVANLILEIFPFALWTVAAPEKTRAAAAAEWR